MEGNNILALAAMFMGGLTTTPTKSEGDYRKGQNLKNGFELIPLVGLEDNTNKYSYLYKDGQQVNETVFRAGGMCSGFKDGYCCLIKYERDSTRDKGFDFGTHVIINEEGEIVLEAKSSLTYPYHLKGVVASMERKYYNLLTGEIIAEGYSSIKSEDFIFVGSEMGRDKVYKIEFQTGNVEVFN